MEKSKKKNIKQREKINWENAMTRTREILNTIGSVVYHFRKIILSIPVVLAAFYLAKNNLDKLPDQVGIGLMSNGQYAYTTSVTTAVYAPLAITGVCLILMFSSRRATYPWLISLFTLTIPLLILITNIFPS